MSLKIAISGAGYIAKIHAKAIKASPEAELVAIVDFKPNSVHGFMKTFGITRVYPTIDALAASGNVDALIICVPNFLHTAQASSALEHGLNVLVEKPMAVDANEAGIVLKAAEQYKKILMVAHCWRFDKEALWLRKQVASGRLGQILRTKGYGVHKNWGPTGWFNQKALAGGGALLDMGIHAVDTTRFLLGDPLPKSVYARIGTYYIDADVDDTGVIIINWENGVISYIESGWWQPHMDGPEASTQLYGKKGFGSLFPTYLELPNPIKKLVDNVDPKFPFPRLDQCEQSMYNQQMVYFINCIQNKRTPVPGGIEGWINMKILDAAYESSLKGKVVEIK